MKSKKKIIREITIPIIRVFVKYPLRVRCNVCGWRGRRMLSDSWHPYTICPACKSQVRHRLLKASLEMHKDFRLDKLVAGKRVLHFAPEAYISKMLSGAAGEYVSADFIRGGVDLVLNMCDMKSIPDASFDFIMACDVLEHVESDAAALKEVYRVLRPGGWFVSTVPQQDGLKVKREDPFINTPEGRAEAYGKSDHVRMYGDDYPAIVTAHGFTVTVVDKDSLDPAFVAEHVLYPPVLSKRPLATNNRRVFFAQKPHQGS